MKRFILFVLALACLLSMTGCRQAEKKHPLSYLVGAQNMIERIAAGDLENAWNPVYKAQADPELGEKFERYEEMFHGRTVIRCDCYDYERTGDRSVTDELYTETTYYKIYLTEDYQGEPDFYAKVVGILDGNGDGIISLEISEDCPW